MTVRIPLYDPLDEAFAEIAYSVEEDNGLLVSFKIRLTYLFAKSNS